MENMLLNLAKQLDSLDEASLMALWNKYAAITSRFEPSRRWEEACLVFSLIQAKHMKNQLFNYNWSQQRQPSLKDEQSEYDYGETNFDLNFESDSDMDEYDEDPLSAEEDTGECRILTFRPLPERLREEQDFSDFES